MGWGSGWVRADSHRTDERTDGRAEVRHCANVSWSGAKITGCKRRHTVYTDVTLLNYLKTATYQEDPLMITSPPHLVELRPGTKPGYVEVLFPWKPAKDETVSLRRAGFRFTVSNGPARWYGKAENAPEGLKAGVQALVSLTPEDKDWNAPSSGFHGSAYLGRGVTDPLTPSASVAF